MNKLKPNQYLLSGHLITERPILFQTEMVKAIIEDRKTQTRRGLKNIWLNELPTGKVEFIVKRNDSGTLGRTDKERLSCTFLGIGAYCPYGMPGDLLWVRETWARPTNLFPPQQNGYVYKADYDISMGMKWKPSIHMPKSACRLWLMVEDVRVERLMDISNEDAIAEGIESAFIDMFDETRYRDYSSKNKIPYQGFPKHWASNWRTPFSSFKSLWESINGKASWKANPWVWVVQYRILSKNGRPDNTLILKHYLEVTGKDVLNDT